MLHFIQLEEKQFVIRKVSTIAEEKSTIFSSCYKKYSWILKRYNQMIVFSFVNVNVLNRNVSIVV